MQCDQIGWFIGLWATFESLWQQLFSPTLPHSWAIFVKVTKYIIFLVKSFLSNFYRHLAIFSGHTGGESKILLNEGWEIDQRKTSLPTLHRIFCLLSLVLLGDLGRMNVLHRSSVWPVKRWPIWSVTLMVIVTKAKQRYLNNTFLEVTLGNAKRVL